MSDREEPRAARRAARPTAPGADPSPSDHPLTDAAREDRSHGWGEVPGGGADERLLGDRPPHWR